MTIEKMIPKRLFPIGIGAAVLALVLFNCAHVVPAGHVGVVKLFGAVRSEPLKPGFYILSPLTSVYDFNVRFQSAAAVKAEGGTSDLQEVFEDLTLNYEYDAAYAPYLYNNFGGDGDIEAKFIVPALYESFKAVTSRYTAEELVTKRSAVSSDVVTVLSKKLAKYHILVSDINVQNFHFDPQFADAVRQKVVAGQNKLTAEQTLETARIQTEQRVVEAEGRAKASAIEAKALEEQGGDKFIALEAIKKWNGQLPAQWSGTAIPFLNLAMPK